MATIRDVAKAARVAPSTVSGVLNKSQGVRPHTRERVESAIRNLGYVRHRAGRPTRDAKRHVAVVMASAVHCLPSGPLNLPEEDEDAAIYGNYDNFLGRAIRRAVVDDGHHIHSYAGYRHVREDMVFCESVDCGEIDGVILVREQHEDGYLDWLLQRDIPLVVINREPTPDRPFTHVEMDNFGGSRQAAEYLVSQGLKRLAVIQADQQYSYNRQRTAGFLAGARAMGVAEPIVAVLENWQQVPGQCERLIAAGVNGLFATTDTLAAGCLHWAHQHAVKVPSELALIGFDDFGYVSSQGMRLSSIGYDVEEIARVALRTLDLLCRHRGQLVSISATIKTHLVEKDTTPGDTATTA